MSHLINLCDARGVGRGVGGRIGGERNLNLISQKFQEIQGVVQDRGLSMEKAKKVLDSGLGKMLQYLYGNPIPPFERGVGGIDQKSGKRPKQAFSPWIRREAQTKSFPIRIGKSPSSGTFPSNQ